MPPHPTPDCAIEALPTLGNIADCPGWPAEISPGGHFDFDMVVGYSAAMPVRSSLELSRTADIAQASLEGRGFMVRPMSSKALPKKSHCAIPAIVSMCWFHVALDVPPCQARLCQHGGSNIHACAGKITAGYSQL